jgi:hypothetical protein
VALQTADLVLATSLVTLAPTPPRVPIRIYEVAPAKEVRLLVVSSVIRCSHPTDAPYS